MSRWADVLDELLRRPFDDGWTPVHRVVLDESRDFEDGDTRHDDYERAAADLRRVSALDPTCAEAQIPSAHVPRKAGYNTGSLPSAGRTQTKSGPHRRPTPVLKHALEATRDRLAAMLTARYGPPELWPLRDTDDAFLSHLTSWFGEVDVWHAGDRVVVAEVGQADPEFPLQLMLFVGALESNRPMGGAGTI